jgi:exodeoxyribonuclease VII small subunit
VASNKPKEEKSFEVLLGEVEAIVRTLQEGGVSLEDALTLYEEGFASVKSAQRRLSSAREKLEVLQKEALTDEEDSA